MSRYYATGATLAGMVNLSTYFKHPPRSVRGNSPTPLTGGVRRRSLSGRMRADGFIDSALVFDYVSQAQYEAFVYAVFGGFTTVSAQRYFTLFDASGHFSPYYGFIELPTVNWETSDALTTVVFPLSNLVLQSVTKSTTATLTASERLAYCNTGSGGFTVTLCAANAVQASTIVSLVKTSASNTLTIARAGSDLINGASTSLTRTANYARVDLVSDGAAAWVTL
jgi:hypothetical protein